MNPLRNRRITVGAHGQVQAHGFSWDGWACTGMRKDAFQALHLVGADGGLPDEKQPRERQK